MGLVLLKLFLLTMTNVSMSNFAILPVVKIILRWQRMWVILNRDVKRFGQKNQGNSYRRLPKFKP